MWAVIAPQEKLGVFFPRQLASNCASTRAARRHPLVAVLVVNPCGRCVYQCITRCVHGKKKKRKTRSRTTSTALFCACLCVYTVLLYSCAARRTATAAHDADIPPCTCAAAHALLLTSVQYGYIFSCLKSVEQSQTEFQRNAGIRLFDPRGDNCGHLLIDVKIQ